MRIVLAIAWRNTWRHTRRTVLTTSTIALGIALIMVLKGLSDGTLQQMVDGTVRMGSGHVLVQAADYLQLGGVERHLDAAQADTVEDWLTSGDHGVGIAQIARRSFVSGLASSADGSVGAMIVGVEPAREREASSYADGLERGRFLAVEDEGHAVLGSGVASRLAVDTGARVVLMAQGAQGEIESILVRVTGIVRMGLDELDDALVLIPLATAQEFKGLAGGAHQLAVLLDDAGMSRQLAASGQRAFPDLEVLDWRVAHPELMDMMQLVGARDVLLSLIVFTLVAFLVLNTLLMAVLERSREFALLEALGFPAGRRFLMVLGEAFCIAIMASVVGATIGYGAHLYFASAGLSLEALAGEGLDVAGAVIEPIIYSRLSATRVMQILGLVFAMTLALALLPARRAARATQVGQLGRH